MPGQEKLFRSRPNLRIQKTVSYANSASINAEYLQRKWAFVGQDGMSGQNSAAGDPTKEISPGMTTLSPQTVWEIGSAQEEPVAAIQNTLTPKGQNSVTKIRRFFSIPARSIAFFVRTGISGPSPQKWEKEARISS
jgi:hypothetical protein